MKTKLITFYDVPKQKENRSITIRFFGYRLRQLDRMTDLTNPTKVKKAISIMKKKDGTDLNNQSKHAYPLAYTWYVNVNGLEGWTRPKYKWVEPIIEIPTRSRVEKIIASVNNGRAVIYQLMAEIGVEGEELHRTHRRQAKSSIEIDRARANYIIDR